MTKICPQCGNEFENRKNKNQKLCSLACSTKWNAENWNFMDPFAKWRMDQKKPKKKQ
jgi:rRNA maturation protein Nop10